MKITPEFSFTAEAFNLAVEQTEDGERIAQERQATERAAAEREAAQARLFGDPDPKEKGKL